MNDYKELIRTLRNGRVMGFNDDGFPVMQFPTELEKIAANAIEQIIKERDEANIRAEHKCDTCKNNFKAEWRGVSDE